ncbi:MAG: hypothetical protein R6V06_00095 [Kiritimatiellia bacterium]
MSRPVNKTLSFPIAGIGRRLSYDKQTRPYSTPYALNVRGIGTLERRKRGGSRPGLAKLVDMGLDSAITAINAVTTVDDSGVRLRHIIAVAGGKLYDFDGSTFAQNAAELLWDDGNQILWEDGSTIVFDSTVTAVNPVASTGAHQTAEYNGKLYLADSYLMSYDPLTGIVETVSATQGVVPAGCSLICTYRDRMILASSHLWFASRSGDFTDWNYGSTFEDESRAILGQVTFSGIIGEPITALIPFRDQSLIIACKNSLWVLKGDPATGSIVNLSSEVGVIAPDAWSLSPSGMLVFLSNDGLYMSGVDDTPVRVSEERVPYELRNVNTAAGNISVAYNPVERGFNIFISATNSWFFDFEHKALWKDVYQPSHFPVSTTLNDGDGLRTVVLGSTDGYLRVFSSSATDDDGIPFTSSVVVGPFRIAADDVRDAILSEIHGILADNSGSVRWSAYMGGSAEHVADMSESIHNSDASGIWTENRNRVQRPRCRGAWCAICLTSSSRWSFEAVSITGRQLGRLR